MKSKSLIPFIIILTLIALNSLGSAQENCYLHDVGFTKWLTFIRDRPSLFGTVVAVATPSFRSNVLDRQHFRGDCWAKVEWGLEEVAVGWLLAENLSTEPVATPAVGLRVTLPSLEEQCINGGAEFEATIKANLMYLLEQAPQWYLYVVEPDYCIQPCEPCKLGTSHAIWLDGPVYVYEDDYKGESVRDPTMRLARLLVHEACHVRQFDEKPRPDVAYARVRVEQECVLRELEMVRNIDPEHIYNKVLVMVVAWPYVEW